MPIFVPVAVNSSLQVGLFLVTAVRSWPKAARRGRTAFWLQETGGGEACPPSLPPAGAPNTTAHATNSCPPAPVRPHWTIATLKTEHHKEIYLLIIYFLFSGWGAHRWRISSTLSSCLCSTSDQPVTPSLYPPMHANTLTCIPLCYLFNKRVKTRYRPLPLSPFLSYEKCPPRHLCPKCEHAAACACCNKECNPPSWRWGERGV